MAQRFLGDDDGTDNPLKSIIGPGDTMNRAIFNDPASRAALLQIGLQMMQPIAMGQTVGGHIGQAVGAGGEEVVREEERQRKEDTTQEELALKERAAASRELEAGTYAKSTSLRDYITNLTNKLELQQREHAFKEGQTDEKSIHDSAKEIFAMVNGVGGVLNPESPTMKTFGGKDMEEIKDILRANKAARKAGGESTVTPTPTPTLPKPGAAASPTAMPPLASRVAGRTVFNGHVWNGTGWDPVTPRNPLESGMPQP